MKNIDDSSRQEMIQSTIDDFNKIAFRILKKGLKEIDAVHANWEQQYELLARDIIEDYDINPVGSKNESGFRPADGSTIEALSDHVRAFQGFDLSGFITKILKDNEAVFNPEADLLDAYFTLELGREFWKVKPGDTRKRRLYKTFYRTRTGYKNLLYRLKGNHDITWGKQRYQPRLFITHYHILPGLRKLAELLEKRMREHAKQYNHIHFVSETSLKDIIARSSASLLPHEVADSDVQANDNIKDSPVREGLAQVKVYIMELEDFFEESLRQINEKSMIAGTPLLVQSIFGDEENKRIYKQFSKDYNKYAAGWKAYFEGEGNDWIKDLDIILFQLHTLNITRSVIQQFSSKVNDTIAPLLDNLLSLVKSSFDRIRDAENSPALRDKILSESRVSLRNLRLKEVPKIVDAFVSAQFIKSIENYSSRINFRYNSQEDDFSILQRLDLEGLPPQISIKHINLKKIIKTEYLDPLIIDADEFIEEAELKLGNILLSLNEIGRMVQVNLETALELLDDEHAREGKKENAGKLVTDGLDRIYKKIEKLKPESLSIPELWGKRLTEITGKFIRGLNELSDNENILNLIIRQARAEASKRYVEISRSLRKNIRKYLLISWRVISFGLTGARSSYEQLSKMAGVSSLTESERELMDFLFTTQKKISKLPYIYQRLYRFEALKDKSIFAGRTEEMERLHESFQLWKSGYFASVAVVGEKGSGRTSFINMAEIEMIKSVKHFRVNLPKSAKNEESLLALFGNIFPKDQPASLDELEKALLSLPVPIVIMVEDLHNIFIRTVKGFDLVERFLLLISRTPVKVFWVISCGKYLWNYLDRVLSIKRYFQDIIYLDDLEAEMIKDIIMKRQRLSGYELEYEAGETELSERRYKRLTNEKDRQEYLETAFFRTLHEHSRGNVSVALLLWQLSFDSIKDDKVIISQDLYIDANFLNLFQEIELFTLEAIIEMEVLTIAEHAEIFHQDIRSSELVLLRLTNKGVLFRTGDSFQIHFLLYKQTIRILNGRNILK